MHNVNRGLLAFGLLALTSVEGISQVDYRNLDAGRPLRVEDAYPLEQKALELLAGWRAARRSGGAAHEATASLTYGLLPNAQLEVGIGGGNIPDSAGRSTGLAGVDLAGLYNLWPERGALPAMAVHAGATLPVGGLAPEAAEAEVGAIATRSFGRQRLHLAGAWGGERWWYGGALDRTVFRSSLLGALELTASREEEGAPVRLSATAGARWQWTPATVLDLGLSRQLRGSAGRDVAITLGLTRTVPTAGALAPGASSRRNEWIYHPGPWNWGFLARYPEAARLFNAFDYGHAVLYERLWQHRDPAGVAAALAREYRFLTQDLLVRPPRFAVAEPAIAPAYGRLAWRAKLVFDWAHVLHRQIYDVYADPVLASDAKDSAIERLTDYYLTNRALALLPVPKDMALMDDQYYSQVFRRRHPTFNGLIWAYHWLQVGLYEPMIAGATEAERRSGVQATVERFRAMLAAPPQSMPRVMPMTTAIAPRFTERHPRAAAIFDNLHMLHDIISDVLAADTVPRSGKAAAITAALDEFQDASRNIMDRDHWLNMAEHMGDLDAMGGPVPVGARTAAPHRHE